MDELGGWGKIYESMFERSLVGTGACVYAVWAYCIAKAQPPEGKIELHPKLVAAVIGESEEDIMVAIRKLCSPDKDSHTNGKNGQRLEHVNAFTYRMVNWKLYRGPRTPLEMREYYRRKQAEYRTRKRGVEKSNPETKPHRPIHV